MNVFSAVLSTPNQTSTETIPVSNADENQTDPLLISPSAKKSFFKKNIEDGMDKLVPFQSINKKKYIFEALHNLKVLCNL